MTAEYMNGGDMIRIRRQLGWWVRRWGVTLGLGVAVAGSGLAEGNEAVTASGVFSGRVWNDANRNGVQDAGEVGMGGCPILVITFSPYRAETNAVTDTSGFFSFSHATNRPFSVWFDCGHVGVSPANVGTNDAVDSDYASAGVYVDTPGVDATGNDLGLYILRSGVDLSIDLGDLRVGEQVQVAADAEVMFRYTVRNTGDVCLASVLFFDEAADDDDAVYERSCPDVLAPGESIVVTNLLAFSSTLTNRLVFLGAPAVCHSCAVMEGFPLVVSEPVVTVVVVTNDPQSYVDGDLFPNDWEITNGFDPLNANDPDRDGDGDGWTDYEEYLAGTDPRDGGEGFPGFALKGESGGVMEAAVAVTSTARLYRVWVATNLVAVPQAWVAASAELPGSGSNLVISLTNPAPVALHRIGVRVP
jgi:hypothetical protein